MISGNVVSAAILDTVTPRSFRSSGEPAVGNAKVEKTPRRPTEHIRLQLINGVPSRCLHQAAQGFPTRATVHLGGSADVKRWIFLQLQFPIVLVIDGPSTDAQFRVPLELENAALEVIRIETQIRIQ